jgi:hypothetical protein
MRDLSGRASFSHFKQMAGRHLVHEVLPLDCINERDADFYRDNRERSALYVSLQGEREAYFRRHPCMVMLFTCMDGRERDTAKALGIPPGAENIYATAGNKIGAFNLVLGKEIQARIDRAAESGKRVLILWVTHESWFARDTDSCAAWKNDGCAAGEYADEQVGRFNADYVDRGADGRILRRNVIAVRLNSFHDIESRVWHGERGRAVDPMVFAERLEPKAADRQAMEPYSAEILARFTAAFPPDDPRFEGLDQDEYRAIIRQMAEMAEANVRYIRQAAGKNPIDLKHGHRERRAFVGRGWEMYDDPNEYFCVSDLTPDLLREGKIAITYVLMNSVIAMQADNDSRLHVPVHVNVPYDRGRPGDRGGSIRHALDLARALQADWRDRLETPAKKTAFMTELYHALKHHEIDTDAFKPAVLEALDHGLSDAIEFYISVSPRDTRLCELVATGGDL